jgi:signal peptidase I
LEIDTSEESVFPLTSKQTDDLWREGLKWGNWIRFRVASGSMYPALVQGDSILVKGFPPLSHPRLGDIVLFYIGETWVVHRVVGKELTDGQISYWQKGDAEYRATLTPASAVAGKVIVIEHDNNHIELDAPWQKIINRSIGAILCAMDRILRCGAGIGKGKGENAGQVSTWRVKASGCFRKTRAVLVAIAARLMRLGARS